MDEAKIERLERAIWEITQLAQELDDMGYSTFANEIDAIVANILRSLLCLSVCIITYHTHFVNQKFA